MDTRLLVVVFTTRTLVSRSYVMILAVCVGIKLYFPVWLCLLKAIVVINKCGESRSSRSSTL